jgi:hypothetical protein
VCCLQSFLVKLVEGVEVPFLPGLELIQIDTHKGVFDRDVPPVVSLRAVPVCPGVGHNSAHALELVDPVASE